MFCHWQVPPLADRKSYLTSSLPNFNCEKLGVMPSPTACRALPAADDLVCLAQVLDLKLVDIAQRFAYPLHLVRAVCPSAQKKANFRYLLATLEPTLPSAFWQVSSSYRSSEAGNATNPRASSLVENLNSRLRSYFFCVVNSVQST